MSPVGRPRSLVGPEVGARIAIARRREGLSTRKLAALAGVDRPKLSKVQRGLKPVSPRMREAVANALGISAEFFDG